MGSGGRRRTSAAGVPAAAGVLAAVRCFLFLTLAAAGAGAWGADGAGTAGAVGARAGAAAAEAAPIRFGLASMPSTLDPRFATDAASSRINRLLYARLATLDESLRPAPGLARWERAGPLRYRFRLRPGRAPFHDGSPVTARDVKATLDFVLDPAHGSPHRGSLAAIEAVTVLDDDTFELRLREPDLLLPGKLEMGILPAAGLAAGREFNVDPVGSGPFELVEWKGQGRLGLRRRSDGQRVEFVHVPDPNTRVLKLVRGEIDMAQGDLVPELTGWLRERPRIEVRTVRGTTFAYIGFNLEDPVTGDPRVRRAIAHAIDRESLIRYVMESAARPASTLLAPGHWAAHGGLAPIRHDPERARALLAEAGYGVGGAPSDGRRRVRIVYKTSTNPLRLRIAAAIQHQLGEAGMDVEVRSNDWGTFYGDIKAGRFQMYSLSWVGIKLPDIFRYVFHSEAAPPAGANRGRFRDERSDRLIEAAERAATLEEQARHYRALQARVHELLPYVPLWYEDVVHAARRGIGGFRLASDGSYDGLAEVFRRRPG